MEEIADAILEDGVFTRDSIVAALERLFTDKIADIWGIEDVHFVANGLGVKISDTHAREVLHATLHDYDAGVGISCATIEARIDETDPRCVKLTDEEAASGEIITLEDNHVRDADGLRPDHTHSPKDAPRGPVPQCEQRQDLPEDLSGNQESDRVCAMNQSAN